MFKGMLIGIAIICSLAFAESTGVLRREESSIIPPGTIIINEVVSSGSKTVNEFGIAGDWIELHNTTGSPIEICEGQWSISDKGRTSRGYELPASIIPAHGHLIIWCDALDVDGNEIHTDFHLAAEGEHLVLWYSGKIMDERMLGRIPSGQSMGTDATGAWRTFRKPTPGNTNEDPLARPI